MSSTALRLTWAALLLAAPARVLRAVEAPSGPNARRVTRLLGSRHASQAAALGLLGGPAVERWSRRIDAAHGLSMGALAATSAAYRRAGLLSLTISTGFVVASLITERRSPGNR